MSKSGKIYFLVFMKILHTSIAIVITMAGTLFACSNALGEKSPEGLHDSKVALAAEELPSFMMKDVNGKTVNLSSFKGKKVFVNLWATWCPPCRAEIPSIEKLYSRVNREKSVFIMLSLDDNFETAKQFAVKNNMKIPLYYSAEGLPAMFNTEGIPVTFIFNEKGKLVKQHLGMADYNTPEFFALFK